MRGLLHQAGTGFGRISSMAINGLHPDMKRENGERKRPCHRPHRFPGRFAMIVYRSRCYFCQINVIKMVFRASPNKKGQHLKGGVNPRHRAGWFPCPRNCLEATRRSAPCPRRRVRRRHQNGSEDPPCAVSMSRTAAGRSMPYGMSRSCPHTFAAG